MVLAAPQKTVHGPWGSDLVCSLAASRIGETLLITILFSGEKGADSRISATAGCSCPGVGSGESEG